MADEKYQSAFISAIIKAPLSAANFAGLIIIATAIWTTRGSDLEKIGTRMAAAERTREAYVPRVDALVAANQLQDERISAMSEAIRQIRQVDDVRDAAQAKAVSDILTKLGDIREDLATIKATIARDGVPLPRLQPQR